MRIVNKSVTVIVTVIVTILGFTAVSNDLLKMPRLGKRKVHLKKARALSATLCERSRSTPPTTSQDNPPANQPSTSTSQDHSSANPPSTSTSQDHPSANQPTTSEIEDTSPSSSETSDTDFDPDESLKKDPVAVIGEFTADWVASLSRDDLYSLSLLLAVSHLHGRFPAFDNCCLKNH